MKRKNLTALVAAISLVVILAALSLMAACGPAAPTGGKQENIDIGGGSIGGSGNQVANALAGILDTYMGIKNTTVLTYPMSAIAPAVHEKKIEIGISNSTQSWDPWYGLGDYKGNPMTSLRELFPRSVSSVQIFVTVDSPIKTFRDLIGKRVCPGTAAMGPEEVLSKGLPAIGLDWKKDFSVSYMGHVEGNSALVAGKIDAYLSSDSPPQPTMTETDLVHPLRTVGFTEADATKIAAAVPGTVKTVIPAKYYHMDVPITSVGFLTQVLVRNDWEREDVVYGLTKYTVENPQFIGYFNKAFQRLIEDEGPEGLKANVLAWPSYTGIPLHKETVRYYRERGWTVPEGRLPPEMKK